MISVAVQSRTESSRTVDVAVLHALAERLLPVGSRDEGARHTMLEFFTADVAAYLRQLTALEQQFVGDGVKTQDLRVQFARACDEIIAKGERVVASLEKPLAKQVKAAFRDAISPWTANNPFLERCLKKPRGYAGDFAMMEVGYLRWTAMGGGLAGAFDRYFADCYDNVRQRKIALCDAIRRYLVDGTQGGTPLRMVSLGAGPCREWVELEHERRTGAFRDAPVNRTRLVCIDQDPEALAYARQQLAGNSLLESVDYVEADLFQFTRAERWRREQRSYDFIYGVGIANYFYDAMLQNIIASAFTLVKPGGELMITHKDGESFNFPVADWLCDWVFLRRSVPTFATVFQEALVDCEGRYAFRIERIPDRTMCFGFAQRIA